MKVALMVTCVNDAMFPGDGEGGSAAAAAAGRRRRLPARRPAARQPMVNTGYLDEGGPRGPHLVDTFEPYDAVVTPSGSCAGSVRHQHAIVARRTGDAALAERVARTSPRTYELTEFLVDVLGVEDVGAYFPHRVTYHPTCHSLRLLGVGDRPQRLLAPYAASGWSTCRRRRSAAASAHVSR
jgi:L-lactate dehydrogenase complex protein LldE